MSQKKLKPVFTFSILTLILSGCANWAQHDVVANHTNRFRLAILPIVVTAEIDSASEIISTPIKTKNEQQYIKAHMESVASDLTGVLKSRLDDAKYLEVVPLDWPEINKEKTETVTTSSWTPAQLKKLRQRYDVQAILAVKLAGYGKMKKKWLTLLIGSGVVEGLVQGILAAKLVNNTWVGIALALEEIGQEVLVWGGGAYLFNRYYSPVTLEAQLISAADGATIWNDIVFVSVDKKAIELLPTKEQNKKEIQLHLTAKKAIVELVEDVNNKARQNLIDIVQDQPMETYIDE
ncbi:MAG: hypothetical protein R3240_13870 [Gammaproteobacteria bacterium]|nr:hypothetical protein [Gammaproteobacteria bacterium]